MVYTYLSMVLSFCMYVTLVVFQLNLWRDVAGLLSKIGANSYISVPYYGALSQNCEMPFRPSVRPSVRMK
jgi:hypothetical protein